VSVSPAEAIIEFESRWLDVSAFRASVPMACAMGGEARGRDLVAKPMAFVDRGTPSPPTVADVEQGRVLPITDEFSPGDAVRRAALIDRLPTPFNRPMYYYVSERLGARSLPCVTRQDETLGTVCRVTMPSLRVALDWVANVNGICGPEYEMFAVDVDRITRGAWQELPARTRERLAGWCDFLPGEQFRCYLNEADFSSHDAGLGGVVITDRRVLFKKHRQHWAVSLESSTTIEVTRQPRFAALTVEDTRGDRHSAGRYHVAGIDHLHDVVADLPHVHVLILESDATGADG